MKQIALIGAGQIGSRHLQALSLLDFPADIYVVDPSSTSLLTAKERFSEVVSPEFRGKVHYAGSMEDMPGAMDAAIVATAADGRLELVRRLLDHINVQFIILEKIVFNEISHFDDARVLLDKAGTIAFVNCARRMQDIYLDSIKDAFCRASVTDFAVEGPRWDIGCNGVHFLDLFSFLSGDIAAELNPAFLEPGTRSSKRKEYSEFHGSLTGLSGKGALLRLSSLDKTLAPSLRVKILSDEARAMIDETNGIAILERRANGWVKNEIPFILQHQSQLSHIAIQQLIREGKCQLPSLDECVTNHVELIKALNRHLGLPGNHRCPIT